MSVHTIIDCYTDEPAGLGVPPYIGIYPRYVAGAIKGDVFYLTIDDIRFYSKYNSTVPKTIKLDKTKIEIKNLTSNAENVRDILEQTDILIVIMGVHTPGRYLSAVPGTLGELLPAISDLKCPKILGGPIATEHGSGLRGGRLVSKDLRSKIEKVFDVIVAGDLEAVINSLDEPDKKRSYSELREFAIKGASIVKQIPYPLIAEIETSRGCLRPIHCSFCTESLRYKEVEFREQKDIIDEVKELYRLGVRHFRLGRQSSFYSYKNCDPKEIEKLLKPIGEECPYIEVLHIDNVNPTEVVGENGEAITKLIVKYCTAGNVAAFGVETFDPEVIERNDLNASPEQVYKAIVILNELGSERGDNGLPKFLPGINLLLGLAGESKKTFEENYSWLEKILKNNLLLRRINIRQVIPFPGTPLYKSVGNKYLRKNRKYYWKFRDKIRHNIDLPMLQRLVPTGTVIKDLRTEVLDGMTTFCRQIGTYPLIVGIPGKRIELDKFINIRVVDHMLRSVVGEVIEK